MHASAIANRARPSGSSGLKLCEQGKPVAYDVAVTSAMLGDYPQALRYLRTALDRGEGAVLAARLDPAFNALHSDPEYQRLLVAIGLK